MANTLFIGKVYHRFDEVPSTNDVASELIAKSTPPEGTVIRADSQSAGRGQFGNRWYAQPGVSLTISVVLYPPWLAVESRFALSEMTSLAVRACAQAFCPHLPITIKWPNDIYAGNKKIAGILIQTGIASVRLQHAVIGIGLNVNQVLFPPEAGNAGSLALAVGKQLDLEQVSDRLLEHLEACYLRLKAGHRKAMRDEYHAHLYRKGQPATFETPSGARFDGSISGVREDGMLEIFQNNETSYFEVKSIRLLD